MRPCDTSDMVGYLNIMTVLNNHLRKHAMHFGGSEKLSRPDTKGENANLYGLNTVLQNKYCLYAIKKALVLLLTKYTEILHSKCIKRKTSTNKGLSVKLNLQHILFPKRTSMIPYWE